MDNGMSLESINGKQAKMKYYSTVINTDADEDKGYMDFDSYLKVLAAQMSNQDFNDPMSDAEFMQQMASYSMMEAIGQMNTQSQISYATSLVGKAVTVSDGAKVSTGVVESVIIGDGKYSLLVNGGRYTTDQITDVVDLDMFTKSREFIGRTVSIKDGDDILPGGKIDDVVFKDGTGYAVIGKETYDLAALIFEDDGEVSVDDDDYQTASVEALNASSAIYYDGQRVEDSRLVYGYDEDGDDDLYVYGYGNGYGSSYSDGYDRFEEEFFDEVPVNSAVGTNTEGPAPAPDLYSSNTVSYSDNNFTNDDMSNLYNFDPASLLLSSNLQAAKTAVPRTAKYGSARVDAVRSGVVNNSDTEGTLRAATASGNRPTDPAESEFKTASVLDIAANQSFADGNYYTLTYGSNSYYGNATNFPNRAFAREYPEEARLADQLGTKMYDIRYIHNTDINSVIRTNVIGRASDGKAFTDIGYCGKGRLGEVVTWADGTQRVELISQKGSSWFTTSGRFTLDEICDPNMTYNGMGKELTPFEAIIRAAAKEYTPEEREILRKYNDIYVRNALAYTTEHNVSAI